MGQAVVDDAPLTVEVLTAHLAAGCKPPADFRIGAEHEKFAFRTGSLDPIPYGGPDGIEALMKGLKRFNWEDVREGEVLIGLHRGGANVSLEPGGQFELSGAPLETVHDVHEETVQHLAEVRAVGQELGIGFLALGFTPLWTREQVPVMPKGRYKIMRAYMPKVGGLGLDMMFRTCTVQVNLDFASEADMVKKFRTSLALQPVATALYANSPFVEGKPSGLLSSRANVWTDTDADRTGLLDFVFDEGFGFEAYVRYAVNVPMYFAKREGRYVDLSGRSFRRFIDGELDELPGDRATMTDWSDHLTTIFPEVRLKQYLEMRGADCGPLERLSALPALWAGVLYDPGALDAAWDLVKGWTAEDRQRLRADVPRLGLKTVVAGRSLQDVALDMLAIAREGLKRRSRGREGQADETSYLVPLDDIAASGTTPAERLLELCHGPWRGDVRNVFDTLAF
jgi:glutamate--cysteine ligase